MSSGGTHTSECFDHWPQHSPVGGLVAMGKSLPTCSWLPAFTPLSCSKSNRRLTQPPPPSIEQLPRRNLCILPLLEVAMSANLCSYTLGSAAGISRASFQGPPHSNTPMALFAFSDHRTMSGRRVVWTTSGNCSFIPTSVLVFQELAACSKLVFAVVLL